MTQSDSETVTDAMLTLTDTANFLQQVGKNFRKVNIASAREAADLCDAHAARLRGAMDALGNLRLMEQASNDWGV